MKIWKFEKLFLGGAWVGPVFIVVDPDGKIISVKNKKPAKSKNIETVKARALPGFINGHSHSFQLAMAGIAETLQYGKEADDFWTWREAMYTLALKISPRELSRVTRAAYLRMLKAGYTWVTEFHYLHNDVNGKPYSNHHEMSEIILEAAEMVGIGLTLIPVFYNKGGFGKSIEASQKRFIIKNLDSYFHFVEGLRKKIKDFKRVNIGVSAHSLRAVDPKDIISLVEHFPEEIFHIHLAETEKEVADCAEYMGQRPVEWFCTNIKTHKKMSFVHCTQVNDFELELISKSLGTAVLCPSTEGSLGDGPFPIGKFSRLKGSWTLGTDSQAVLNPFEELRWLDFGSRLNTHRRNTFTDQAGLEAGDISFTSAIKGGRAVTGLSSSSGFEVGDFLDVLVVNESEALLSSTPTSKILSTLCTTGIQNSISGVITSGKWVVRDSETNLDEKIERDFKLSLKSLSLRSHRE